MIYKKVEIKVEGYQEIADLYTYILDKSKAPGHRDLPGWRLYNDL